LTAGQLIGPPIGAYAASILGYRPAFIFVFIVVTIFLIFCHLNVDDIPRPKKASYSDTPFNKSLFWSWNLILIATLHLTFMPSILPEILGTFRLTEDIALKYAGFIIMSYTATAILGNYSLSRLSSKIGLKKVITIACILAGGSQLLLIFNKGIFSFIIIRMIQTGFIAAVIPLVFSIFARDVSGRMIGFLNSARFVGAAVGPFMATSVLAYSNLLILYLLIAGLTFGSLWTFMAFIKPKET
jgi:MFS family permease